jgi:proteasome lid subunit RPN8/RPN11
MKYALTLILMALASAATAEEAAATFPTMDAAAIAAETAAMINTRYEFGGCIFTTPDGLFHYTVAQTSNNPNHIKVKCSFAGHLVAIYHTHPGNVSSDRYFSEDDVDVASRMKVPSYIGVSFDKTVHKFVPGVTHTERSRENGRQITLGEVIK